MKHNYALATMNIFFVCIGIIYFISPQVLTFYDLLEVYDHRWYGLVYIILSTGSFLMAVNQVKPWLTFLVGISPLLFHYWNTNLLSENGPFTYFFFATQTSLIFLYALSFATHVEERNDMIKIVYLAYYFVVSFLYSFADEPVLIFGFGLEWHYLAGAILIIFTFIYDDWRILSLALGLIPYRAFTLLQISIENRDLVLLSSALHHFVMIMPIITITVSQKRNNQIGQ